MRLLPRLFTSLEEEFIDESDEYIEMLDDERHGAGNYSYRKLIVKGLNAICFRLALIGCGLSVFTGVLLALLLLR